MDYQVKKSLLGREIVSYQCPKCGCKLNSPFADAGKRDSCPDCQYGFLVPGSDLVAQRETEHAEKLKNQQIEDEERAFRRRLREEKKQKRREKVNEVVISTGDIKADYKIITVVMALCSDGRPGLASGRGSMASAFDGALQLLRELAVKKGGNAVINCQFEHRAAVVGGEILNGALANQAAEIFAYGTVVKLTQKPIVPDSPSD